MPPKSRLKSLKARFRRILSDREGHKNHEFKDSASSSSSSNKQKLSPPSRFKKKISASSSSSVNSKTKKSLVRAEVSSSSSSSHNMNRFPSEAKKKTKKKSSSSSEFSSDSQSGIPVKSIKKLQLIGLESRLKLPLNETFQVSPSSKVFASDPRLLSEKDRDQPGSRRGLWSTTLSPTSTETSSPALPRYSFSLNDSSSPSSPGRPERIQEEPSTSQSAHEPTFELLGKSEGNSKKVQSKISSPNVKRVQSAFLDDERGVWRCRICGWIYPNPNPSARHRRDHKKHCGEMLNVQQWLKVTDSGPVPGVQQFDTVVGKAPSSRTRDRGLGVIDLLLDLNRAAASEKMTALEEERVTSVEDGKKELLDPENVAEVNTLDSRVDTPELDVESREGDSHTLDVPDNANGFADNDTEGQVSQADAGIVNSASQDIDDVGVNEVEEQTNVEDTEEDNELQNAEAMEEAKDGELVAGLETSEVLKGEESQGETQVDDAHDGPGIEGSRQVDREHLGDEAKGDIQLMEETEIPKNEGSTDVADSVGDPTTESFGVVEDVHREFSLSDDDSDMKITEEAEFGTAAPAAGQEDVGCESENEKSGTEAKFSALRNDGELVSFDSGDASFSYVVGDSNGNGNHTEFNGLKEENETDTLNEADYVEPQTVVGTDENADYERSFVEDSSVKEVSPPKSLLVGRGSASSSSSWTSPSAGDSSDNDINTPRNAYEDVRTPLAAPQEAYYIERKGSTDAKDINLTQPVEETTAKPWRSRNAMQDELIESIIDEAVNLASWTRHQDVLPETVEGTPMVMTPTTSTTTASQSPPDITGSSSSTSYEVVPVGSSIKKVDFKSRQKYWAEVTRSDILEGSQKLLSSTTSTSFVSEDHRTPPLVDDVQSLSTSVTTFFSEGHTKPSLLDDVQDPSSTVTTAYHSRQDNNEKEVVVAKSELVLTEASSSNFHADASSSNFHTEASTSKFRPLTPAGSSNAFPVDEYDLERVIHEQKTHDIMCPVCGSCITKRVILRKRKRYLPREEPKRARVLSVTPVPEPGTPVDEGWGCLACFSIFFPRVRPGKEVLSKEPTEGSSCLQIAFPSFSWGPKERTIPAEPGIHVPAPPPPSSNKAEEEDGCFSYLRVFKRPSVFESPRPGILEPAPPSSSTSLPPGPTERQEEEGCLSYFKISRRPSAPEGPRPGEEIRPVADVKDEGERDQGATQNLEPDVPPVLPPASSSLPVSPRENNLAECFKVFLPVFPWGPGELNVENEMPRVIPLDDRKCLPLFRFPRTPPQKTPEEGPVPTPEIRDSPHPPEVSPDDQKCLPVFWLARTQSQQTPEIRVVDELPLSGDEHGRVQTPEPLSPPPRECLPFFSLQLYQKAAEHPATEPTLNVEQRELWRDWRPLDYLSRNTHQLAIQQFFEEKRVSVIPVPSPSPESLAPREERATSCISLVLPTFPWGPPVQVPEGDSFAREPAKNCLDLVLPSFSWGPQLHDSPGPATTDDQPRPINDKRDSKEPVQNEGRTLPERSPSAIDSSPAGTESRYTRKTIISHVLEKEIIVRPDSIEVNKWATHIESRFDKTGEITSSDVISDKPSDSVTDAGSSAAKDELAKQVADKVNALSRQPPQVEETDKIPKQNYHEVSCSCLPFELPSLSWSWESHPEGKATRTSDLPSRPAALGHSGPVPSRRKDPNKEEDTLTVPLLLQHARIDDAVTNTSQSQYHSIDIHEKSLTVTSSGNTTSPEEGPVILKSLVYGGLDTTLISLGVISSATGGDASTLTVISIGLANVVFGFLAFLGTITALYRSDREQFKQLVGPSYRFNGLLAGFAYLLFGLLPPLTYGFSFRHQTNRDWKMGSTCLVALVCLILLGLAKARVTSQKPYKVIMTLVTTGFVAAIASYKVGDYVSWLLKDLGFDSV